MQYIRILGSTELHKPLKLTDLENIFWSLQTAIATNDNNPLDKLREYLIEDIPEGNNIYSNMVSISFDMLLKCHVQYNTVCI